MACIGLLISVVELRDNGILFDKSIIPPKYYVINKNTSTSSKQPITVVVSERRVIESSKYDPIKR